MRLAWRLARREVRRRPGRTVLVVLLVAITVAGISVADLAYRARELPGPSSLGRAAAKAVVTMTDGDERDPLPFLAPYAAPGAETVDGFEVNGLPVRRADEPGLGMSGLLLTADAREPLLDGLVQVQQGRLPAADDEVVLGPTMARVLELNVGDTLHLARPELNLRVVGIATTPDDTQGLFLAPGYPIDEIRIAARAAVLYMSSVADLYTLTPDVLGETDPTSGPFVSLQTPPEGTPSSTGELLIGWVVMALILGVLGIIVAAAFAASGRRQLVTLGQLGATGGDERFARRYLALQGSVTGAFGAVVGVMAGVATAVAIGRPVLRRGELNLVWLDVVVIVATTLVVATAAALLPTRRLAKVPVLTALAGRAPVARVRSGQVGLGVVAIVAGLLVMGTEVAAARGGSGGASTAEVLLAVLSAAAVLGGVCALSPKVVDQLGAVGSRATGTTRLAIRSLVRHRARSAAMVAAIAAIGAAGVAGASGVEQWRQLEPLRDPTRLDVVTVGDIYGPQPSADPNVASDVVELQQEVEGVLGPVRWTELRKVGDRDFTRQYVVATDAALAALDVPKEVVVFDQDGVVSLWRSPADPPTIVVPGMALRYVDLISPAAAAGVAWVANPSLMLGHVGRDITPQESDRLLVLSSVQSQDGYIFGDPQQESPYVVGMSWETPERGPAISRSELRWIVIGSLLVLIALIVATGLALWAAEGRFERDQLVAVGAPPRSLASMAGVRALVLSATGGVMAVPLGMVTLWVVLHAAGKESPFPTLTAAMVVVGLPVVIAVGAFVASVVAQRLRPATASTMSLD